MSSTGGCYCGAIRYELSEPVAFSVNCHCRNCRLISGGAFVTVAAVKTSSFEITRGESKLRRYSSGPGDRFFCDECGGRLFSRGSSDEEYTNLLIATLDEELQAAPICHINVESKAPWYEILDAIAQFDDLPDLSDPPDRE